MSVTLSPPARVAAFVGALLLTGLAAVVLIVARGSLGGDDGAVSVGKQPTAKTLSAATARPKPAATSPGTARRVPSGLPPGVDHALRYSRVVVVSVSVPGGAVDAVLRREARSAAKVSGVDFVAISAANERAVSSLMAKAGVLPAPAVVIVKRPGVVTSTFSVTDATTLAQAVAQARR